jgi:hypothetical protein
MIVVGCCCLLFFGFGDRTVLLYRRRDRGGDTGERENMKKLKRIG